MKRFETKEEALEYVKGQPFQVVMELAAERLMYQEDNEKVILTETQFKKFFRIRGYNDNGEKENRGRKAKD